MKNIISKLNFTTVILVILSAILTAIFLYLVIDTIAMYKENQRNLEEVKKSSEEFTAIILDLFSNYDTVPAEVIMPKPEVKTEVKYILGEKKECEDKGGYFDIKEVPFYYRISCLKRYNEGNKSITETIFDYKI